MSACPAHVHMLRAAFQTCRPRSSLRPRSGSRLLLRPAPIRHHSNDTVAPYTPSHPSSVSQEEVSHFSRLASSWWDPYGPSRLLHLMNPLRHDFIHSCLQSDLSFDPNQKLKYLDIGCGGGIFASSAARKSHTESVTAIDPTPEVIAVAKAQQRSDPALADPKLTYLNCAIEDLAAHTNPSPSSISNSNTPPSQSSSHSQTTSTTPASQYDILTLFEVIEHISTPSTFLTQALSHLKPGGWLIGSTISRHPISYLTTKLIAEAPLIGVVPAGTHDWNKYIKPAEMRGWFDGQRKMLAAQSQVEDRNMDRNSEMNAFGPVKIEGVVYVPVLGWKFVKGSEEVGNYFFGVQKLKGREI